MQTLKTDSIQVFLFCLSYHSLESTGGFIHRGLDEEAICRRRHAVPCAQLVCLLPDLGLNYVRENGTDVCFPSLMRFSIQLVVVFCADSGPGALMRCRAAERTLDFFGDLKRHGSSVGIPKKRVVRARMLEYDKKEDELRAVGHKDEAKKNKA